MANAIIEEVKQTENAGLFTIRFEGQTETEFEKFMQRFKDDAERQEDLSVILNLITKMLTVSGFLERLFRYEGKMSDRVAAMPQPTDHTELRLYCLRLSDSVLIVGNGGVKNARTYEESEELNGYVITLQKLDRLLKQAEKCGKVTIEETKITGIDKQTFNL